VNRTRLSVECWVNLTCHGRVSFTKISLTRRLTVIAGPRPPSDDGFCSDRLQVLHWRVDEPFGDDGTHLHRASDEVYVVLEGAIDLEIDGSRITVAAGEAVTVGAGVSHALVAVQYPARGLTIRGPAIDDKVVTERRSV
jgi:mannose-6-phosphate isomerase-like protein (cupin superfamily)